MNEEMEEATICDCPGIAGEDIEGFMIDEQPSRVKEFVFPRFFVKNTLGQNRIEYRDVEVLITSTGRVVSGGRYRNFREIVAKQGGPIIMQLRTQAGTELEEIEFIVNPYYFRCNNWRDYSFSGDYDAGNYDLIGEVTFEGNIRRTRACS